MGELEAQVVRVENLLMVLVAHPHHGHLHLVPSDLEKFYNFLEGPKIGRRSPPPSLHILMRTERAAWRKISIALHGGTPLKDALAQIMSDTLFWVREVYEHIQNKPMFPSQSPRKVQRCIASSGAAPPG
eukprot:1156600-Amphidinium_carterae.1